MSQFQLMRRAVVLFPRSTYTADSDVRHARREYINAMAFLRNRESSIWILDRPVQRVDRLQ